MTPAMFLVRSTCRSPKWHFARRRRFPTAALRLLLIAPHLHEPRVRRPSTCCGDLVIPALATITAGLPTGSRPAFRWIRPYPPRRREGVSARRGRGSPLLAGYCWRSWVLPFSILRGH
jgi:hypothetical protein